MAIRTVVTRGFGNGTYTGTIGLTFTRGYVASAAVAVVAGLRGFTRNVGRMLGAR